MQAPYDWPRAQAELARGVSPAVVALRLGVLEEVLVEVADDMGWPVTFNRARSADAVERLGA